MGGPVFVTRFVDECFNNDGFVEFVGRDFAVTDHAYYGPGWINYGAGQYHGQARNGNHGQVLNGSRGQMVNGRLLSDNHVQMSNGNRDKVRNSNRGRGLNGKLLNGDRGQVWNGNCDQENRGSASSSAAAATAGQHRLGHGPDVPGPRGRRERFQRPDRGCEQQVPR